MDPRPTLRKAWHRLQPRRWAYAVADRPLPPDYGKPLYPPASFPHWVARCQAGRPLLFPSAWRSAPGLRVERPSLVGVIAHVQRVEAARDLVGRLRAMPVDFDLVVTNPSGHRLDLQVDRVD